MQPLVILEGKAGRLGKLFGEFQPQLGCGGHNSRPVGTRHAQNSIDYVFTDPLRREHLLLRLNILVNPAWRSYLAPNKRHSGSC